MPVISDVDERAAREFGCLLEPRGFRAVAKRKWVRSTNGPIRHLLTLGALKGATYCPIWGASAGLPIIRAGRFRRQTTERNATMDLVIDPIDTSGDVPREAFALWPGVDVAALDSDIRRCAATFVPRALADLDRVQNLTDFAALFLERSGLRYRRFQFEMYTRHRFTKGFVHILRGDEAEGRRLIRTFCEAEDLDENDQILQDCLRAARGA